MTQSVRQSPKVAAALAIALLVTAFGGAAGADTPLHSSGSPATLQAGTAAATSNFAGYVFPGGASVTATFKIPKVTCPTTGISSGAIGTGLNGGSAGASEFLQFQCGFGSLTYFGYSRFGPIVGGGGPHNWTFSVSAGDTITSQITTPSTGSISIVVHDVTKGLTDTDAGACASCSGSSGSVAVNGNSPIPNFKSVKWSGVGVDGMPLASMSPTAYVQVNALQKVLISTSKIAKSGTTFTNRFVSAS